MKGSEPAILLVEDDPDDAFLTLRALERQNVSNEVTVVTDGAEALDYLFAEGKYAHRDRCDLPAVVLLDLRLPKIDGLDVLRRIRADGRTRLLPVVILTSSNEEGDIVKSYEHGCNSYVQKPVDFTQFSDAVRQLGLYWMLLNRYPPKRSM